uniref:Uncharacterized protein n=1 Tax=Strigamia maritima TaxID=126957 RepID=T1ISW0_STRMM
MADDEGGDSVDNFLDSELIEDHFTKEVSKSRYVQAFDDIAVALIRENFLLTALEFHTELVENGQELPRLRDFFSNPGNFERKAQERADLSPGLPRTSSVQTFDSLDFARYSDDGDKQVDERVAVLEFELRKAKETIKSLRANLTFATESESNVTDTTTFRASTDGTAKPHEKRALNFLINEYLLKQNYKLTSITFCDENEDQLLYSDFEDWDDVGLNIPKPPNLMCVYRDFTRYAHPGLSCHSVGLQVNLSHEDTKRQNNIRKQLEFEITTLQEEIDNLKKVNSALNLQIKTLESSAVTMSHSKLEENPNDDFVEIQHDISVPSQTRSAVTLKDETDSKDEVVTTFVRSPNTLTAITKPIRKVLSDEFHTKLVDYCCVKRNFQDNRLAAEVADVAFSNEKIVLMLGRCLPHIVPNVLLAKREELIPVILCTIALHPDDKKRDNLLNILFNLIKRPDDDQRLILLLKNLQMILSGFVTLAQQLGPTRVQTELLPQCWEQIAHKYIERRLLVIEASGVLAPYLPSEICSSLLLSMLQQMFEDKSDVVREAVAKNLALILTYICDTDKFSLTYRLLLRALEDNSECVVTAALHTVMPVFASWALELNRLQDEVFPNIFKEVEEKAKCFSTCEPSIMPSAEERLFLTMISAMKSLIPWLFLSVVQTGPFVNADACSPLNDRRFPAYHFPLEDLYVILGSREKVNQVVNSYDNYINQEWFETWKEFEWLTETFFPSLISVVEQVPVVYYNSVHELVIYFHDLCTVFADDLPLTSTLVPLYICGVLEILYKENNRKELLNFLHELIHTTADSQLPLDTIRTTFMELSSDTSLHELLIGILWDNVTNQSALIRACCARLFELLVRNVSESTLATRLAPALVTLANDPDIPVRIATIPAFGAVMEVTMQRELMDKVRMQFLSFLEDPQYQDHTAVLVEVIRTFGQTAPNADSKFREDFVLPHLVAIASQNAHTTDESKRLSIAVALLDAYTSLSYCCIIAILNDQLITDLLLPGLRFLLADIQQVAPEQVEAIAVMINELSAKVEISRPSESRNSNSFSNASTMGPSAMEDMKNKMSKMFMGATNQGRANIASIFQSLTEIRYHRKLFLYWLYNKIVSKN